MNFAEKSSSTSRVTGVIAGFEEFCIAWNAVSFGIADALLSSIFFTADLSLHGTSFTKNGIVM